MTRLVLLLLLLLLLLLMALLLAYCCCCCCCCCCCYCCYCYVSLVPLTPTPQLSSPSELHPHPKAHFPTLRPAPSQPHNRDPILPHPSRWLPLEEVQPWLDRQWLESPLVRRERLLLNLLQQRISFPPTGRFHSAMRYRHQAHVRDPVPASEDDQRGAE